VTQKASGRRPFQISIGIMMLVMVVFAVMSAGFFYASRVPAIRDEVAALVYGKSSTGGEDIGRSAHIAFIMFTFTSPLLLAGLLSTGMSVLRWFEQRR
jgi:hypothetical protein